MVMQRVSATRVLRRRPVCLIEQQVLNRPITQDHRLNLPSTVSPRLPDLADLSPPARLGRDLVDFSRHKKFFTQCLSATKGAIPLVVTDQHLYSLPFYKAIAEAKPGEEVKIVSLDAHLDGIDITYSNWSFWGFGIHSNLLKPENLSIIGSLQQIKAERFMQEHTCAKAISSFEYQPIEQFQDFTRLAAERVVAANPALEFDQILADKRLRDFAEYALLKNAGVELFKSSLETDLSGQAVFVSFDTDVTLQSDALLAIARQLRGTRVVGFHISELHQGIPLHGNSLIEEFVRMIID